MSAEIYHCAIIDDEPDDLEGQVLENSGIFWIDGFGDGMGNETFVIADEDKVKILNGRVTEHASDGENINISIAPTGSTRTLKPGKKHVQALFDIYDNTILLHVRNIGGTALNPDLN